MKGKVPGSETREKVAAFLKRDVCELFPFISSEEKAA
jgi:hypothetical protein